MTSMLLSVDCCCLSRPFDDHSQIRARLEAEAVQWLLDEARGGRFTLVTSDYLILEILKNPDHAKRERTLAMTRGAALHVPAAAGIRDRALQLGKLGFAPFDALHLSAAESARCRYLVTTDVPLLEKSRLHQRELMVFLITPLDLTSQP